MKCPKCGNPRMAYNKPHLKRSQADRISGKSNEFRKDFSAECKKCGWKGNVGGEK